MQPRLFVFGLGYVGLRLASLCSSQGWEVAGSCREADRALALRDAYGIDAHAFDLDLEYAGLTDGGRKALEASTVCVRSALRPPSTHAPHALSCVRLHSTFLRRWVRSRISIETRCWRFTSNNF